MFGGARAQLLGSHPSQSTLPPTRATNYARNQTQTDDAKGVKLGAVTSRATRPLYYSFYIYVDIKQVV